MSSRLLSYRHLLAALVFGLALRVFFIVRFPFVAGDSQFYEELARNWLQHGVYGLFVHGQLTPVDMRMPGYPAFLAAVYRLLGQSSKAVMAAQAFVDLATCVLVALLAARLAPASKRTIVATVALWMAALCPFTANYTAVVLTEVLATFLTTLALLLFVWILGDSSLDAPPHLLDNRDPWLRAARWLLGGFVIGLATLVRPETPLLLVAVLCVLGVRWRRPANWPQLALAGSWMVVGLLVPLTPWAVRNARTLGRAEFLSPRYAEAQGAFIPRGFYAWTGTWMVRFGDAYLAPWKLGKVPIYIETLPRSAFDSEAEYVRVDALLSRYNRNLQMTPLLDRDFALLAQERTRRRPLRTYLFIPLTRAWFMWITPRIELLPYSGKLWPPRERWRGNPTDFGVTLAFGILGLLFAGLALAGAWRHRTHPGLVLIVTYIAIRTALLTQLQTVEPRYLIVCFPLLVTLGALAWVAPQAEPENSLEADAESHGLNVPEPAGPTFSIAGRRCTSPLHAK